jgi:hypothetical protein
MKHSLSSKSNQMLAQIIISRLSRPKPLLTAATPAATDKAAADSAARRAAPIHPIL